MRINYKMSIETNHIFVISLKPFHNRILILGLSTSLASFNGKMDNFSNCSDYSRFAGFSLPKLQPYSPVYHVSVNAFITNSVWVLKEPFP